MRVSGRPGRTDPVVGRPVRTPSGLAGRRPAWPDAGRPGRPWPEWCVPGWPVAGLWFTIGPKNDVSQKRPERAASLNSGVFTFWISYVGQAGLWSDWRAGGRPVVGLAGRGRPPAGLVGRWPAWPDAVRRGWTASGVVGSSRPPVCTSLQKAGSQELANTHTSLLEFLALFCTLSISPVSHTPPPHGRANFRGALHAA